MVSQLVLRAQSQAAYAPRNIGHFGLNLGRYAHFTSPIRRYADLVVHRALISALRLGEDGLEESVTLDELQTLGGHLSRTERRGMEAERNALSRFTALLLAERIGSTFAGRSPACRSSACSFVSTSSWPRVWCRRARWMSRSPTIRPVRR